MHRLLSVLIAGIAVSGSLTSCKLINSILHDEEVVAKVGNNMLYKSEVTSLIPSGISGDDSLRLAMQYINSWASDMVYLDIAEKQLSKTEKDVSKQLETYRRALLKYRYEQLYVNERLDTAVTYGEVEEYYRSHTEDFRLERPIVRACYLNMLPESTHFGQIKDLMSSTDEDSTWQAEQLASSSYDRFTDYADSWIDVTVLAGDLGVGYETILPLEPDTFIETEGQNGKHNVAYIFDAVPAGEIPPVEFCAPMIKDIILSARKHRLTASLEQELREDARDKGKFVIY